MSQHDSIRRRQFTTTTEKSRDRCDDLVLRLKAGDQRAFGELQERMNKRLNAYFKRRVPRKDAEDVLQDTWTIVWKTMEAFVPGNGSHLDVWIIAIAKYATLHYLRQTGKRIRQSGKRVVHLEDQHLEDQDLGEWHDQRKCREQDDEHEQREHIPEEWKNEFRDSLSWEKQIIWDSVPSDNRNIDSVALAAKTGMEPGAVRTAASRLRKEWEKFLRNKRRSQSGIEGFMAIVGQDYLASSGSPWLSRQQLQQIIAEAKKELKEPDGI